MPDDTGPFSLGEDILENLIDPVEVEHFVHENKKAAFVNKNKKDEHIEFRKSPPGMWRTKEGVLIKIEDMTDGHLRNTIRFIRKKTEDWVKRAHSLGRQVTMESALRRHRHYGELVKEAQRRGLTIDPPQPPQNSIPLL
jgi:hypothetical protein